MRSTEPAPTIDDHELISIAQIVGPDRMLAAAVAVEGMGVTSQ
jgi:hypothetical protein